MKTLEEMMKELPTEYQKEVLDFIEFLVKHKLIGLVERDYSNHLFTN